MRFLASRPSGILPAGVTEPGAMGRLWATCPDYDTAIVVAEALEEYFAGLKGQALTELRAGRPT